MWEEIIDNCEAVLFDLDGTLIDSMWLWKQVDMDFFKMCNMEYPADYQQVIEGMSMYETAVTTKERYGIDMSIEEILEIWNKMAFDQYSNHVQPKDKIREFLEYLVSKGKKLGIATSNSTTLCHEVLDKRDLKKYFEVIVTGEEKIKGKPAPDVYLMVAKKLNVSADKCIVFEDLPNGIRAGKNALMTTVAIWDEYSSNSWDIKVSEADYHIMGYGEIIDEICK